MQGRRRVEPPRARIIRFHVAHRGHSSDLVIARVAIAVICSVVVATFRRTSLVVAVHSTAPRESSGTMVVLLDELMTIAFLLQTRCWGKFLRGWGASFEGIGKAMQVIGSLNEMRDGRWTTGPPCPCV